jgi:membrane protein DedA with SNARE-associated domain
VDALGGFLDQYGLLLLGGAVLLDQLGIPLPGMPVLLAAGALVAAGTLSGPAAVGTAVGAAVAADAAWYGLGRWKGSRVLALLCRVSLEPDACVRRTENVFARYGLRALLFAKFVPGMGTVTAPLAGLFRIPLPRFLLLDALGAFNWAGAYMGLGFVFADQLEAAAAHANRAGGILGGLVVGLAGYVAVKLLLRRRATARLMVERVAPEELARWLDAGTPVAVVDLRHPLDVGAAPVAIPGAIRIPAEELAARAAELPLDRDVVVYCL